MANKLWQSLSKNLIYLFFGVVGVVLFIGVFKKVGWRNLFSVIDRLSIWQLVLLLGLQALFAIISLYRWRLILGFIKTKLSWRTSWRAWLADFAFSYLSPAPSFGGEPLRLKISQTEVVDVSWPKMAGTIVIDKIFDATINVSIIIVGIFLLLRHHSLPGMFKLASLAIIIFTFIFMGWGYWRALKRQGFFSVLIRLLNFNNNSVWRRLEGHLQEMEDTIHYFLKPNNRLLLPVILLALLRSIVGNLRVYLSIFFVSGSVSGVTFLILISLTSLVGFLPLPGGLGGLETAQAFLFVLLGLTAQQGLVCALLNRLVDSTLIIWGLVVIFQESINSFLNNFNNHQTKNI